MREEDGGGDAVGEGERGEGVGWGEEVQRVWDWFCCFLTQRFRLSGRVGGVGWRRICGSILETG